MLGDELLQIGHARHRAIVVHDLADHARGRATGHAREIHGTFGVTTALQHAAVNGAQRKYVSGADEIGRRRRLGDRHANRVRAVGGTDARGHAFARLDGHRECSAGLGLILFDHHGQAERRDFLVFEAQADQTASKARHEIDGFGRRQVGRHDQVAFVLATLVVDQHHHFAGSDVFEGAMHPFNRVTSHDSPLLRFAPETTLYTFIVSRAAGVQGRLSAASRALAGGAWRHWRAPRAPGHRLRG